MSILSYFVVVIYYTLLIIFILFDQISDSYGIDINAQNNLRQTALHICADRNDTVNAKRLVETPRCDPNVQSVTS